MGGYSTIQGSTIVLVWLVTRLYTGALVVMVLQLLRKEDVFTHPS